MTSALELKVCPPPIPRNAGLKKFELKLNVLQIRGGKGESGTTTFQAVKVLHEVHKWGRGCVTFLDQKGYNAIDIMRKPL